MSETNVKLDLVGNSDSADSGLAKFSKALGTAASSVQVLGAAIAATTALGALMKDNLGTDFATLESATKRFGDEVVESLEQPMRMATQAMTAMMEGMTRLFEANEPLERIRDYRTEFDKLSEAYDKQKAASDAAGLAEAAQIDYAKELFVALKCKAKSPAGRRGFLARIYSALSRRWQYSSTCCWSLGVSCSM